MVETMREKYKTDKPLSFKGRGKRVKAKPRGKPLRYEPSFSVAPVDKARRKRKGLGSNLGSMK